MIGANTSLCQFCPWLWLEFIPLTIRSLIISLFIKCHLAFFSWHESRAPGSLHQLTSIKEKVQRAGTRKTHLSCFMILLVSCTHTHTQRFILSKQAEKDHQCMEGVNPMNRLLTIYSPLRASGKMLIFRTK